MDTNITEKEISFTLYLLIELCNPVSPIDKTHNEILTWNNTVSKLKTLFIMDQKGSVIIWVTVNPRDMGGIRG